MWIWKKRVSDTLLKTPAKDARVCWSEVLMAVEKPAPKGRKSMVKLPWELLTPFGDFLRGLPSKQGRNEDEEEEDEDELQAYHDSMQRLKVSRLAFGRVC